MAIISPASHKQLVAPDRHKIKRVGRGIGSRLGKTSGRGMNGQRARSGGGVRIGFEGGQMPLYRRLPRRGFSNAPFKVNYKTVSLSRIVTLFNEGESVTEKALREKGIVKNNQRIKIVSGVKIETPLRLELGALRASQTVIAAVKECGGTVTEQHTLTKSSRRVISSKTAGKNTQDSQEK